MPDRIIIEQRTVIADIPVHAGKGPHPLIVAFSVIGDRMADADKMNKNTDYSVMEFSYRGIKYVVEAERKDEQGTDL